MSFFPNPAFFFGFFLPFKNISKNETQTHPRVGYATKKVEPFGTYILSKSKHILGLLWIIHTHKIQTYPRVGSPTENNQSIVFPQGKCACCILT